MARVWKSVSSALDFSGHGLFGEAGDVARSVGEGMSLTFARLYGGGDEGDSDAARNVKTSNRAFNRGATYLAFHACVGFPLEAQRWSSRRACDV